MKEKYYDAIAREIYLDIFKGEDDADCRARIAAIIRKHDEAEANGELLSDIIETSRMEQHDFNGRTGLFCHQSVDGIFETYSAPTDEKALIKAAQAMLNSYKEAHDSGDWGNWDLEQDREYVNLRSALLAREAPKDESKEGGA
jgi:hypothetical protein